MRYEPLYISQKDRIKAMSAMATEIVREHFDPIIGTAQNDYMLAKFQTVEAVTAQLSQGYQYYFVTNEDKIIGFLAFYPKDTTMYLSKFYLYKEERGKGYARDMLAFVIEHTKRAGLSSIELNVNRDNSAIYAYEKMGFYVARTEKNDIGQGFFMDDYVYRYDIF